MIKHIKKRVTKSRKRAVKPKDAIQKKEEVIYGKSHCLHCGGILRVLPDEKSCVNCGRLANHKCERCMCKELEAAV